MIDTYEVCSDCLAAVEYPDENNNRPHYEEIRGNFPPGTVSAHGGDATGHSNARCELCGGLPGHRHSVFFLGRETP